MKRAMVPPSTAKVRICGAVMARSRCGGGTDPWYWIGDWGAGLGRNEGGGPEGPPQSLQEPENYWTTVVSTFSTHSGKKTGSRFDQPGAVAAASLIDWSRVRRRSGWRCGRAEAAQNAPGSHGRTLAPTRRS